MHSQSLDGGSLEMRGDYACYRPTGQVTLSQVADWVDRALACARDQQIPKLLINVRELFGYPNPSLPERYFICRRWAATAGNRVQLALVLRAEMMDPEKFGVMVARNAGMKVDAFTDEAEAQAWLAQPSTE